MASEWFPVYIETDDARAFWQNRRIKDLDTLRAEPSSFTYAAMDCEGKEGHAGGVTSIGLAFLPSAHSPQMSVFETWPWDNVTLDGAVLSYNITSLSLRIRGRHRGRVPEPFRYGKVEPISLPQLEDRLKQHLQAAKQQKRLILVAWSIENEMRAMQSLFPGLLSVLDGWMDLADITSYMSGIRTKQKISLRDTLITLGLVNNYSVQTFRPHDPGMDAARTAAALAGLVACPTRELTIPPWTWQEKEIRKQRHKRPSRDQHPYAIRISTQDGSPMPLAISSSLRLEGFVTKVFATPTMTAVCPLKKSEKQKTHGWICFDTLSAMKRFVQQLNGFEVNGVGISLRLSGPSDPGRQTDQIQPARPLISSLQDVSNPGRNIAGTDACPSTQPPAPTVSDCELSRNDGGDGYEKSKLSVPPELNLYEIGDFLVGLEASWAEPGDGGDMDDTMREATSM
ncbi:hypothetical protein CONLIGDRAFT_671032 [Coniochaeta ligniaria NRRL 30616]|uniref:Uncharacterized protein n=1 Tax=Coniochaeta ligniaria NRRL 30616 TaxID=1408157 RepID=A0A1J7IIU1_9PEZI|nr:hypothetical protein CONLIGDRAFT_671032 [Coniochaeta ligniaria NRRL 30616]